MENKSRNTEIKITKDGSHTLYSNRFHQSYHNTGGAVSESRHIFFDKNGLTKALKDWDKINILEIGFGTGLNFLLLLDEYLNTNSSATVNYQAVEAYPASSRTIEKLNYENFVSNPDLFRKLPPVFRSLKNGMNNFQIHPNIQLSIFYDEFEAYDPSNIKFDYIFHDAFSPKVNPELWTRIVFKKLLKLSRDRAVLTTYCAASKVRGAMTSAGWKAARAPGALKKREMTVASPTEMPLNSFKRINEQRLAERFENNEFS